MAILNVARRGDGGKGGRVRTGGGEGRERRSGWEAGGREENRIGEEVERRRCKNLETNHVGEIG